MIVSTTSPWWIMYSQRFTNIPYPPTDNEIILSYGKILVKNSIDYMQVIWPLFYATFLLIFSYMIYLLINPSSISKHFTHKHANRTSSCLCASNLRLSKQNLWTQINSLCFVSFYSIVICRKAPQVYHIPIGIIKAHVYSTPRAFRWFFNNFRS